MVFTPEIIFDVNSLYMEFSKLSSTLTINVVDPFSRKYMVIVSKDGNEDYYLMSKVEQPIDKNQVSD